MAASASVRHEWSGAAGVLRGVRAWVVVMLALAACLALSACDQDTGTPTERVKIAGESFTLEIADENAERFKGLSGRTFIEPDGGLVFVFPPAQVQVQQFLMRDCPVAIDILYLDGAGRVLACYAMVPEAPRGPGEGHPNEPMNAANRAYDTRLKKYSSRYPCGLVIEVAGGTIERLKVKEGDVVTFTDLDGLKKRAK